MKRRYIAFDDARRFVNAYVGDRVSRDNTVPRGIYERFITDDDDLHFTDEIYGLNRITVASVLRGLFTNAGCVVNEAAVSYPPGASSSVQFVGFFSTSRALVGQVQTLLLAFGIKRG